MDFRAALPAFVDELAKIAAAREQLAVSQTRSGRRPISVGKLLEKDKDGTLFRKEKKADSTGSPQPFAAGPLDPGAAKPPRRPGDGPSKEDNNVVDRRDSREFTSSIPGSGRTSTDVGIGAFNSPAERDY